MRFSLAQINPTVGDLTGNIDLCVAAAKEGERSGADVVILPEMAIPGYPPRDLLLDTSFIDAIQTAHLDLAARTADGPPLIVGSVIQGESPGPHHPGLLNVALLMQEGKISVVAEKRLLPGYDVFFEPRWFVAGLPSSPFEIGGRQLGVLICEDLWSEGYPFCPGSELIKQGAEVLITISASPFRQDMLARRHAVAGRLKSKLIYVNTVGCTDELLFDGGSFGIDDDGEIVGQLSQFEPAQQNISFETRDYASNSKPSDRIHQIHAALVMGIKDFCRKNRQPYVVLGLSGGIDSAVVASLAADALGLERVTGVAIPSRFTDRCSTETAARLAQNLGITFQTVQLERLHQAALDTLGPARAAGTAAENIQVRLRTLILMGIVNQKGGMLLNTSNKTELALGYATLYGDLAGGLSPLGDITKPDVYALARHINRDREIIPNFIMNRPPSAELKANQVDPFDYHTVAPALEQVIQANQTNPVLMRTEHKRRQFGIILKVSEKGFGSGRMVPVTRR